MAEWVVSAGCGVGGSKLTRSLGGGVLCARGVPGWVDGWVGRGGVLLAS